jgi:hypothetical protein
MPLIHQTRSILGSLDRGCIIVSIGALPPWRLRSSTE